MKHINVLIMILIMTTIIASSVAAEGILNIDFVNQDSDPVEPGDYVDIRWKVNNLGTDPINDVQIELLPDYPFSLDPGETALKNIPVLDALQKTDTGYTIKYKVRVDNNAVEGKNTIKLRYKTGKNTWSIREDDINVQSIDANIGISSVQTTPEDILPGTKFDLKIKIRNMADSVLKDVSLQLDTTLSTISAGAATTTTKSEMLNALPFAPLKSATEKKIRNIKPGEEVIFSYSLVAYSDAEAKVYKIPIQLNYYDGLGTQYTKDDIIGLIVSAKPDIRAVINENPITKAGTSGDISVKFVNKGLTNIKFVNVIAHENNDLEITGAKEEYIGNIDSDDYESVDFAVYVKNTEKSSVMLPLTYEFMDANNNKYTKDVELEMKLCTGDEEGVCQENKSSPIGYIIGGIILIVILFLIIRAVMKRRKTK